MLKSFKKNNYVSTKKYLDHYWYFGKPRIRHQGYINRTWTLQNGASMKFTAKHIETYEGTAGMIKLQVYNLK